MRNRYIFVLTACNIQETLEAHEILSDGSNTPERNLHKIPILATILMKNEHDARAEIQSNTIRLEKEYQDID